MGYVGTSACEIKVTGSDPSHCIALMATRPLLSWKLQTRGQKWQEGTAAHTVACGLRKHSSNAKVGNTALMKLRNFFHE